MCDNIINIKDSPVSEILSAGNYCHKVAEVDLPSRFGRKICVVRTLMRKVRVN